MSRSSEDPPEARVGRALTDTVQDIEATARGVTGSEPMMVTIVVIGRERWHSIVSTQDPETTQRVLGELFSEGRVMGSTVEAHRKRTEQ